MSGKRTIVKKTATSNIPVLKTKWYTISNNVVTYTFGDTVAGIFAPFEGVFLLKIHEIPNNVVGRVSIKIDNIYGEARTLYIDNTGTEASFSEVVAGVHLCYFDTNERRLYLVQ